MQIEDAFKLLAYIERNCQGVDSYAFWTSDGQPDIVGARQFAEGMRAQLRGFLCDLIEIEQRVNAVFIRSVNIGEPCAA